VQNLHQQARAAFQRRLLVLSGRTAWCHDAALEVLNALSSTQPLWLGRAVAKDIPSLHNTQVASLLGRETDLLIYDAHGGFDADAFGLLSGTLRGGGILVLLAPPLHAWSEFLDPEHVRIAVAGVAPGAVSGRFLGRLARLLQSDPAVCIFEQDGRLPRLPEIRSAATRRNSPDPVCRTPDQLTAVTALLHLVSGHRRRPLVLVSDRGRGKSSALGIAAARLLQEGSRQILVTAPSQQATAALFGQAAGMLPQAKHTKGSLHLAHSSLVYMAPDLLLQQPFRADLLLVDEAAAIPTPLLEGLLERYPRIAFATTVHGYEGTGRGFALRFHRILDQRTPQWRQLRLDTPIRWAPDDPLERWLFQALALNASPVPDEQVRDVQSTQCTFERLDRGRLATHEQDLKDLFGLLVLAHYRTTPFDLRHLLDGPNLSVFALRARGRILATALLAQEGGFDEASAHAIWAGYRRPRGHLLAQSLAAHLGLPEGACLRGGRIIRIAVHPALQRRGLGGRLVQELLRAGRALGLDYLGTSFGATTELLRFWYRHELLPVRIGLRRGASSGERSALLLYPLSERGTGLFHRARRRFQRQLPSLLRDPLREMDTDLAALLLSLSPATPALALEESDWNDLIGFAYARRAYESTLPVLEELTLKALTDGLPEPLQTRLLIMRVVQHRAWPECASTLRLAGRNGVENALRRITAELVLHYADDGTHRRALRIQSGRSG
jgi:tRNA(Met) cytidine acetyltransferase